MKVFEITGTYVQNGNNKFTKKVRADNEKMAKEYAFSLFGGKQKIPRKNIKIESIKEAK
jgi:ribosomal protein L20A (L18A)